MKIKAKHLKKLHIYCSLICCTLLLFFSFTGISLNHRTLFEATPKQSTSQYSLSKIDEKTINFHLQGKNIYLNNEKLAHLLLQKELSLPSPGKRLELYIEDQQLFLESSDFGLVSKLNELHQGRYTSTTWKVISDITAIVLIIIAITGVWLSFRDTKQRKNYFFFLTLSLATFILLME